MPRDGYYALEYPTGEVRAIGYVSYEEAVATMEDMLDRWKTAQTLEELANTDKNFRLMRDRAYHSAAARARQFGREIMTREEFGILWDRAGGRCEVTGIAFSVRPTDSGERIWPWHASIDRVDNSLGYEFENCRLVCVAVNMALHEFGEDVFAVIARCYVDKRWRSNSAQQACTQTATQAATTLSV